MNRSPMTNHSNPLRIKHIPWYVAALSVSPWARLMLLEIQDAVCHGRHVWLSQASWAEHLGCSPATVTRALRELREHGHIYVIRRGKMLTNLYRLSRNLWGRITGRLDRKPEHPLQPFLSRLREKFCPDYATMDPSPVRSTA